MKRDLHLKKVYVAVALTALTMLPTAVVIGALLNNNIKSSYKASQTTSIAHQQTEILPEDVCN